MFFRTAKECWSDIVFITIIVALVGMTSWFISLVPFAQNGILAMFIGISYIMGFNDGRFEQ
jgi:hypothetical protein